MVRDHASLSGTCMSQSLESSSLSAIYFFVHEEIWNPNRLIYWTYQMPFPLQLYLHIGSTDEAAHSMLLHQCPPPPPIVLNLPLGPQLRASLMDYVEDRGGACLYALAHARGGHFRFEDLWQHQALTPVEETYHWHLCARPPAIAHKLSHPNTKSITLNCNFHGHNYLG